MIETLTADAIAKLAFDEVIQTSVGKLTEAALARGTGLWQKIRGKVKEEGVTEAILVEVENQKSLDILEQQVVPFLQVAMLKDPQFAQALQNIAQQLHQEIKTTSQDIIEQENFETHDSVAVVGKVEAQTPTCGGTHLYLGKN